MKKQDTRNKKQKGLILDRDAKILRLVAKPIPQKDIGTKKLGDIIAKMKKAVRAEEDGVAIAAPQIGASLRMFVVKGGILPRHPVDQEHAQACSYLRRGNGDTVFFGAHGLLHPVDQVFINPEMIKASKKKHKVEEGCLSVRYLYGAVDRHEKATITAYDEKGAKKTFGASGLLAQIFQHEIDHLEGVLFTDKAENVRDLPPEKGS
ncbi:MAG: hypothetical protein A3F53_02455 [Candidatus Zambryskibacteria bacterium RIFCSPHIGHO2_12_FULL_48_10]|nr:MAG: hypothetical protein A3F53_02455 [Candidatus Zambryskibacteria bacterium RIFCSPHIGHO2_12_FULL_48_10]